MSVDHSQEPDPIEELLLTAYPNAERKGCPGRHILESLANQQRDESDPNWYHIWHCSPCFAEFKALRDARWERDRAEARRRKSVWWIGATAALVISVFLAGWFINVHRRAAAVQIAEVTLDLSDLDATRGADHEQAIHLAALPRHIDNVRLILPRFSEAGRYTVAVLRSKESRDALALASATTVPHGQLQELHVRLDLSHAPLGNFLLGTRLDDGELVYYYPLTLN